MASLVDKNELVGLGCENPTLIVFSQHRPELEQYQQLTTLHNLQDSEISFIGQQTGNHWRKIFNVFAKIVFALAKTQHSSWQQLRDDYLLQTGSGLALLFNPKVITKLDKGIIKLVMGKTFARTILNDQPQLSEGLVWIDHEFAFNPNENLIICPYFDYRQLSDKKIIRLCNLINKL
ncbi:DUF6942 family protein [Thalassotalea aquiviva]|uniref:DUF6942 family protein n=1 Tax=Thalassotalea aquiviva TaxID=3242415 RepID=UPI00352A443E